MVTWCGVCGCDFAGLTRGTPRIETKIAPNSCFHSCHLHIIFSRVVSKPQLLVYLILHQDVPHISIWRWSRYTLAYPILVLVRGCAVVKTGSRKGYSRYIDAPVGSDDCRVCITIEVDLFHSNVQQVPRQLCSPVKSQLVWVKSRSTVASVRSPLVRTSQHKTHQERTNSRIKAWFSFATVLGVVSQD